MKFKGLFLLAFAAGVSGGCCAARAEKIDLPVFGAVTVLDQIDCTTTDHRFQEYPTGASQIQTVLGKSCRVLPPQEDGSFFGYRIGEGKGLKANGSYVLVVEYPEDTGRVVIVRNGATESCRGFFTGKTLGDAWYAKYVDGKCESLDIPLSGKYERWTAFCSLQDKTFVNNASSRALLPADGFDVILAQYGKKHAPLSAGVAASRILICEVPDEKALAAPVVFPPSNLPKRHLFWREEMADGVISGEGRGVINPLDWYDQKARQMRFLGMNTFSRDLLEFGANQGWDSSSQEMVDLFKDRPHWKRHPESGYKWFFEGDARLLWGEIVKLMGRYGYDVLPYYEYAGSHGDGALGFQKRAKTLNGNKDYTHVNWVDKMNADITDPDTYDDFKKLIDATVLRWIKDANMLGVWLRPRQQLPIGFGDSTLARFVKESNNGQSITRDDLKKDKALYKRYIDWWGAKRRDFLVAMHDYMKESGIKNPQVILDNCGGEPGVSFPNWRGPLVTDDKPLWDKIWREAPYSNKSPDILTPQEIVSQHLYLDAMKSPGATWGNWEWQHCAPGDDPEHYQALDGVNIAHVFNRLYTVSDPLSLQTYENKSGTVMIRHHSLNENMVMKTVNGKEERIVGYAISDMERAGRACMQSEIVAMANGNPTMIGYLVGSTFSRGFPGPVREFNQNFLALPALPMSTVPHASRDPEIVVKKIDAGTSGTYYVIMNTGDKPKREVEILLPGVRNLQAIVSGKTAPVSGGRITMSLNAWQLVSCLAK